MTRQQGVVASASALVPFGHLGWGFSDRAEFAARAAEYIADGLKQNQSIEYVGDGSRDALEAELAAMTGIQDRLDGGGIVVTPSAEFYRFLPGSDVVDPESTIAARAEAAQSAIDDGYTGLRTVVDATPVSRTREQRDALARFEFLIDRQIAQQPVSALCGYDITELGEHVAEFLCLHPFVGPCSSRFRLYAEAEADFALSGEIDAASTELFSTTVRRALSPTAEEPSDETLVIDAQDLQFISQRLMLNLDRYARTCAREVVLRTSQGIPARLAELLDLTNVRVEAPHDRAELDAALA